MCHSNPAIQAKYNLPDTTVSYLASFHGKSTLLGSDDAANCLDCHVGQTRDVHQIIAHTDITAPTKCFESAGHLPGTGVPSGSGAPDRRRGTSGLQPQPRGGVFHRLHVHAADYLHVRSRRCLLTVLKMLEIVVGQEDDPEEPRTTRKPSKDAGRSGKS